MKMEKRTFRIGELAHHLELQQFVIRFWEKEFNFKSHRSQGGQRFYTEMDLQRFERIKEMLYNQGLTIAGAKKQLNEQETMFLSSPATTLKVDEAQTHAEPIAIVAAPEVITIPSSEEIALAVEEPVQPPSVNNEAVKAHLLDVREKLQKLHTML